MPKSPHFTWVIALICLEIQKFSSREFCNAIQAVELLWDLHFAALPPGVEPGSSPSKGAALSIELWEQRKVHFNSYYNASLSLLLLSVKFLKHNQCLFLSYTGQDLSEEFH